MQKPYKVSYTEAPPAFDSVSVAKITDYPLEPRDYRPFAQCILCAGADGLHLRMWAFEVSPMPTSAIGCVMYPYSGAPETAIGVWAEHGEGDSVTARLEMINPTQESNADSSLWPGEPGVTSRPFSGEDLQGVYWGAAITLPVKLLEWMGGSVSIEPGTSFAGNFYKTCRDERFAHSGSCFPAMFPHGAFARESMGVFQVVGY